MKRIDFVKSLCVIPFINYIPEKEYKFEEVLLDESFYIFNTNSGSLLVERQMVNDICGLSRKIKIPFKNNEMDKEKILKTYLELKKLGKMTLG